jgi:putative nucleotidyltransferase with HDIG domain
MTTLPLLHLPHPIAEAIRILSAAQQPAWFVGGAVRDLLLERPVKDFDIVMAGDGLQWGRRLARDLKGSFVVLDEVRKVGRVVVSHEGKSLWLDVATFRGANDTGDGTSLEEDLRLRDFTVNAIAIDPIENRIVDPTGGVAHLKARELHPPSPQSFTDDPLRILRGVRLYATHDFTIPPATHLLMQKAVSGLATIAMERVREEWMRLLAPPGATARVRLLDEIGVIDLLLPELSACKGVTQSMPHSHDVFEHQLLVLTATEALLNPQDPLWQRGILARFQALVLAHLEREIAHEIPRWLLLKHVALLHDIGKVATRTVGDDGRIHFYNHDQVGATLMEPLMVRWKFPTKAVDYATDMLLYHLRPLNFTNHLPPRSRTIYSFYRDAGDIGVDLGIHTIADQRGKAFAEDRATVMEVVKYLWAAYFDEPERFVKVTPLLNGHEVMALTGLKGKRIGELLERLKEQQAQQRITTKEAAETWLLKQV